MSAIDQGWPEAGDGTCCFGAAVYGPGYCTCWEPVYDLDQAEPDTTVAPGVMPRRCSDCAYLRINSEVPDDMLTPFEDEGAESLSHDDIKAALEAATPRPWHAWDRGIGYEVHVGPDCEVTPDARCHELNGEFRETFTEADAHLVANAPEWLDDLLGEVGLLRTLKHRHEQTITELAARAEAAEQAVQRVRDMPATSPSGGYYMVSMRDVLRALDGGEQR